ncbi:MAG: zinc dependent phospholipase C family protein [Betaproteobacteria bacterium]|nr:zinc dependent phospholipase C family protein [Betaproteobacteria bacterium]
MQRRPLLLLWLVPLCLYSTSAFAWGLYTHVYFAQLLIWVVPIADPALRRLARRMPHLVMSGACLPDLAVLGPRVGTPAFRDTHEWGRARALLHHARSDEEKALALGFSSHLLVDVIAHNHFVPAHETVWVDIPLLTHLVAEWAMDAHVERQLFATPAQLLDGNRDRLARFVAEQFHCPIEAATRSLRWLGRGDHCLRTSRVPNTLYRWGQWLDPRLRRRFDYYAAQTATRLAQINRLLEGAEPAWSADLICPKVKRARMRNYSVDELRDRLPLPADLFRQA